MLDILNIFIDLLHPPLPPLHFLRKRRHFFLIAVIFIAKVIDELLLCDVALPLVVHQGDHFHRAVQVLPVALFLQQTVQAFAVDSLASLGNYAEDARQLSYDRVTSSAGYC